MRKIGKYRRKKQKKIIIITSLSLLLFLCVGYAAFSTTLSLKAKGNIKQKGITSEGLKENVVESGDGLYKDIYEDERYIYKGANPNNYITFNNETWRIISVEADKTIKIIKNETIGSRAWHIYEKSIWSSPTDLNTYLNDEYLPTINTNTNKIVSHTWSIGQITNNNSDLSEQIINENETLWTGTVGLITVSEYIRANTNTNDCGNFYLNNTNLDICRHNNWLKQMSDENFWTISQMANDLAFYIYIDFDTYYGIQGSMLFENKEIYPVLYLSSDTTLSGSGTRENPYTIIN